MDDISGKAVILGDPKVAWIDGKPYPWAKETRWYDSVHTDYRRRGVLLVLENHWELSIIWGAGTYCVNYHYPWGFDYVTGREVRPEFVEASPNVEIAVNDPEDSFGDTPLSYVRATLVADLLAKIAVLPSTATHETVLVDYDHDDEKIIVEPRKGIHLASLATILEIDS